MCAAEIKNKTVTIPLEEYEAMKETIEILSDPEATKRILESIEQAKKGKTISEEEFRLRFGL
jgi:PHD/YefM family antitoxin component YafN of YafNO toxin-antitoxin module